MTTVHISHNEHIAIEKKARKSGRILVPLSVELRHQLVANYAGYEIATLANVTGTSSAMIQRAVCGFPISVPVAKAIEQALVSK